MVIIMKPGTKQERIQTLVTQLEQEHGVKVGITNGVGCTILGLVGDTTAVDMDKISINPHVERVMRVQEPYKNANRKFHPEDTVVKVGNTQIGGNDSNVEFEAEVQVNDPNCGLRIGMNTRLTVLLEEKQDVFGVPYDAVVEKADGSTVVYAAVEQQNSGKNSSYVVTEIPVTTGLETDFYIEISGGEVTPGMAVISNPQSVTPGMEVTPDFVANGTTQPTVGLS